MSFSLPENLFMYVNPLAPKCFVYFVSDGEYTKIGFAKNMNKRLSSLQVGNPKKLHIVSFVPCSAEFIAREIEKLLHEKFSFCKAVGEWFKLPGWSFKHQFLDFAVDYEDWERRYTNAECRRAYKRKYCDGRYFV